MHKFYKSRTVFFNSPPACKHLNLPVPFALAFQFVLSQGKKLLRWFYFSRPLPSCHRASTFSNDKLSLLIACTTCGSLIKAHTRRPQVKSLMLKPLAQRPSVSHSAGINIPQSAQIKAWFCSSPHSGQKKVQGR